MGDSEDKDESNSRNVLNSQKPGMHFSAISEEENLAAPKVCDTVCDKARTFGTTEMGMLSRTDNSGMSEATETKFLLNEPNNTWKSIWRKFRL